MEPGPEEERARLRALRAERLARLQAGPAAAAGPPAPPPPAAVPPTAPPAAAPPSLVAPAGTEAGEDAEGALEDFLRALTAAVGPVAVPAPVLRPAAAVVPLPRPAGGPVAAPCDLARLPGAGPGLVGALRRRGIADLADLAGLEADALAARLGPLGALVPAAAWIAFARAAG